MLLVAQEQQTLDTTTKTWALNLRSNLLSWTNWMNIKAANAQVAQAEVNYQAAEQNLILRVATAYFAVLSAYDNLVANQASLEAIARQLDQADKRFEVGLIAITDVQEAKAARDTAAAAVIAAKRSLATAENQLEEITGEKYDRLAKPGGDMPLKGPDPQDESRWVNISLEQNLSLMASRLGADIARDNVRSAMGGSHADPRSGGRPLLQQVRLRPDPRRRVVPGRRQQAQRPADRPAVHAADLQRRLHPVQGAPERVPVDRRQGGRGAELARHRARRRTMRTSA